MSELESFENIIDSFVHQQVGVSQDFLSADLSKKLRLVLLQLELDAQLKEASIGNQDIKTKDSKIRSDKIYWLDRSHENAHENQFLDLMDAFVLHLNKTCFTGITNYEFHFAIYPPGSFYKKHIDQFKSDGSRSLSMIFYLNEQWAEGDGGELCLYHKLWKQLIAPRSGLSVLFKSQDVEHEVLKSHKQRLSITGWFKTNTF